MEDGTQVQNKTFKTHQITLDEIALGLADRRHLQ